MPGSTEADHNLSSTQNGSGEYGDFCALCQNDKTGAEVDSGCREEGKPLYIHMKEGPKQCSFSNVIDLKHWPVMYPEKKTFIFYYERNAIQEKIYGKKYK